MESPRNTSYGRVSLIFISLSITLLLNIPVMSMAEGDEPSFSSVVQTCFSSWVPDGSDRLTPSKINRLVLNHQVKGDEAAAIAAIHIYFRSHKTASSLTKADLLQTDMAEGQHEITGDLP
jgi:hypothetical protein